MTVAQNVVYKFLGPRNLKGLYKKNPLAFTPAYGKFTRLRANLGLYRAPFIRNDVNTNWQQVFKRTGPASASKPFPSNQYTRNNLLLSTPLKKAIVQGHKNGKSAQALSLEYGLTVSRIDAVIRLAAIKEEKAGTINKDLRLYSSTMRKLFRENDFDEETGRVHRKLDNLTEIPLPQEALQQRFATIAESEPFGPLDAAEVLGIEPASETLQRLVSLDEKAAAAAEAIAEGDSPEQAANQAAAASNQGKKNGPTAFFAPIREGDRSRLRFTSARVGHTGFRYGASRDDRKHGRIVRYRPDGSKEYGYPVHS